MASRKKLSIPRVVIAGLRGGSGKTTLSVGLAAALGRRGISVAPFKKGPDYIDAGWLASAAGRPCRNLDPFLIGEDTVLSSFLRYARGAGCAVVEGNRGLFDGMDARGSMSTARVARIIKSPVVLIVDCTKTTRTSAAMVLGAKRFERGLSLGGVVLNMTAGRRHETVTRQAIERYTGVPVLGAIPRLQAAELPERHMGLTPWQEYPDVASAVLRAAELMEKYVDLSRLLRVARAAPALPDISEEKAPAAPPGPRLRIGVIIDSAFQFYYPENIEALEALGAEVVVMSALEKKPLPPLDALYIGGGFPETHALALSQNPLFMESLVRAVEDGLPVYAECGGLMYLGRSLALGGKIHPMAGVLPVSFALHIRPRAHGYTVARVTRANPFYKTGTVLRGHEFHYSDVMKGEGNESPGGKAETTSVMVFKMQRGRGISGGRDGLCHKNVLATYTHVHALGTPEWAEGMIRAALRFRKEKNRGGPSR